MEQRANQLAALTLEEGGEEEGDKEVCLSVCLPASIPAFTLRNITVVQREW